MRRLAAVLVLALAAPAWAEAPDTALRPLARPLPEAPLRPLARAVLPVPGMDSGVPLAVAEVPGETQFVLEARISTRNILPMDERLARIESEIANLMAPVGDGPAGSEPAAVADRLAMTPDWTGPEPTIRPAAFVPPQDTFAPQTAALFVAISDTRPTPRTGLFEDLIRARLAPMVYTQQVPPGMLPEISPLAVAQAVVPPMRAEDFVTRVAAPVTAAPGTGNTGPARPLVNGSGVCGVAILSGRELGHVSGPGQCGVDNAVEITAVGGIALSTGVTVDCDTASALAKWVQDVANPTIGNAGGGLARLEVGGGYACRGRNNVPGARLSEHAFGHAIDIMGFRLADGTRLMVVSDWGNRMLRAMHRGACGIFGTVLGPDANAYHRDHFHFDTARYRSGSYCE